ncbi:malonate decarboxylase, alpha subunit [Cedecea neteri]|uniref:Malonate decarboxylase, alpha subunit n=1 Tax=Cedecea neteri TaxID=158822 RepID=A0A2X2SXY7_9ENTR|nr:malonate decarboxylase, alpha subunit [Cedecea neteri]
MVAAVAGITDIGLGVDAKRVAALRQSGKVAYPEDMGDPPQRCDSFPAGGKQRCPTWSNGPAVLYNPPAKFRSW